jgi:hypothetical protein
MADMQEIVNRWNNFLNKISERHEDILNSSMDGFKGIMEEYPTDPIPLFNAVKAIELRIIQLNAKIEDTFSDQVVGNISSELYDEVKTRTENFRQSLSERWEKNRTKIVGDFFRNMHGYAEKAMNIPQKCSQCTGQLEIASLRSAKTIKCDHCGAANQVIPAEDVTNFFSSAPDALAEEATIDQRIAIERFILKMEQKDRNMLWEKKVDIHKEEWEQMELEYWKKYTDVRCSYSPLTDEDRQRFINSRMQMWRELNPGSG